MRDGGGVLPSVMKGKARIKRRASISTGTHQSQHAGGNMVRRGGGGGSAGRGGGGRIHLQ